jgi:hypothetical protein
MGALTWQPLGQHNASYLDWRGANGDYGIAKKPLQLTSAEFDMTAFNDDLNTQIGQRNRDLRKKQGLTGPDYLVAEG